MANKLLMSKQADQQVQKAQLDDIIKELKQHCTKITQNLALMQRDVADSEKMYPKEPETHVKRTVHKTYTHKFHDLVRMSQTLQSEYKNTLNSKVKGQIRVFHPNVTEDELNEMRNDPEAALK